MITYRFLLFDLDGTISRSAPGIIKGVTYGLDAVGIHETDAAKLQSFIGPPLNVQAKKLYHMSDADIVTFVNAFRERYENQGGILDCEPYEGIGNLLAHAQQVGKISAVASSKPEPFVRKIIAHFGLTDDFTVICGSDIGDELNKRAVQSQKARIIKKALTLLAKKGYAEEELAAHTVMIGDTGYDIDGAKDNHLPSIGVTYGYGTRAELTTHGADAIVDTVDELERLILEKQ